MQTMHSTTVTNSHVNHNYVDNDHRWSEILRKISCFHFLPLFPAIPFEIYLRCAYTTLMIMNNTNIVIFMHMNITQTSCIRSDNSFIIIIMFLHTYATAKYYLQVIIIIK